MERWTGFDDEGSGETRNVGAISDLLRVLLVGQHILKHL